MRKIGGYVRPWTAAEYLGIPLGEVQKMLETGELPGIKIDGQWRVPLDQLEQWLDEDVTEKDLKKLASHLDVSTKDVESFIKNASQEPETGDSSKKANGVSKKKK